VTAEALRFKQLIAKAAAGALLDQDEAGEAFAVMMAGGATPAQIAGFLMAAMPRPAS
jgi:anthranilate phosphoribosyltransferase